MTPVVILNILSFPGNAFYLKHHQHLILEIKASLSHDTQLIKIECKSLSVHQ
jgi:hypothetical protein